MKVMAVMAAVMAMVMAVMACGISYGTLTPTPADPLPNYGVPTPTITAIPVTETMQVTTRVIAPNGLRLRNRPDAEGPTDSVQQAIMPYGEIFTVTACRSVFGEPWAYGAWHVNRTGWAKSEFLNPDPCK
jgi:hypothetical protein